MNYLRKAMNSKILILTEGGKYVGFGHIVRCSSLYQAFEESGYHPVFIVKGDESVMELLKDKNHKRFDWLREEKKLLSLIKSEYREVVIVDSYLANVDFYNNVSRLVKVPVFLDDNNRIDYPRGIVLNWSIYARDLQYKKNEEITYLLGPEYLSLRKAFDNVQPRQISEKINTIVVTMGGDDSKNLTPRVLNLLYDIFPSEKKYVIIGRAFKNLSEIKKITDKNTRLVYYPDDIGMKKIMLQSDLAITSGGQTIYELARAGLPTAAVATAENQVNNVKAWEKVGFIKYAGSWNDDTLINNLRHKILQLVSADTRLKCSQTGQRLIAEDGKKNVVTAVRKKLSEYKKK